MLWFLQSSRFSFNGGANIEAIIASEKEVWNREKLSLQKSLKRAEAEVYKLKAELRNEALLQNLSSDSEHATIKVSDMFHLNVHQSWSSTFASFHLSLILTKQKEIEVAFRLSLSVTIQSVTQMQAPSWSQKL